MITEDYVSFEVANLLKEKGFDEPCFRYAESKEIYESGNWMVANVTGGAVGVPTLQMAMKWLREVHNIFINISFRFSRNADNDINFSYYAEKYENHYGYGDGEFISYEEACEAAIKYCLEKLI